MNVPELTLAFYEVQKAGGFTTGGLNFDAKIRRQSIDPDDLLHAHVASMDACARAWLNAAALLEDGALRSEMEKRYAGWDTEFGRTIRDGGYTLEDMARMVEDKALDPKPRSGRQEYLEGVVNRFT
jgi:xylose isomerase